MKTSNSKARQCVQNTLDFKGNNIFGHRLPNGIYAVWSYGLHFPLFAKVGNTWFENEERYSVSTSKQRVQLHPHTDTTLVPCAELRLIIER